MDLANGSFKIGQLRIFLTFNREEGRVARRAVRGPLNGSPGGAPVRHCPRFFTDGRESGRP